MTERQTEEGFPKAKDASRPWVCQKANPDCTRKVPCASCRGRRSRRKGQRGQSANLKTLENLCDVQARWAPRRSNEETADHLPVRYENKAGKSTGANAVARHYLASEAQSEAARAVGDLRPFVATFSPDGWSDGLAVIRTSLLPAFIEAVVLSANRPEGTR